MIAGVNTFAGNNFVGSDLIAISKPPAGTACPNVATFKIGFKFGLVDVPAGNQVFTPVPANEIDTNPTGYVVARNGGLPSNRLWFFKVTRNAGTGDPVFGNAQGLTVPSYTAPPNAPAGTTGSRTLDTLDARPTQAVVAINPDRGADNANGTSLWTQHTVKHATQNRSVVRWYEINPVPAVPTLTGRRPAQTIGNAADAANVFFFSAAISSDRRVQGATEQFGDNVVIGYSATKRNPGGFNPRIVAGSSVNGAALAGFITLRRSSGPYVDFSCAGATDTCRWGDYSASTPDPKPLVGLPARGVVWHTNQWGLGRPKHDPKQLAHPDHSDKAIEGSVTPRKNGPRLSAPSPARSASMGLPAATG